MRGILNSNRHQPRKRLLLLPSRATRGFILLGPSTSSVGWMVQCKTRETTRSLPFHAAVCQFQNVKENRKDFLVRIRFDCRRVLVSRRPRLYSTDGISKHSPHYNGSRKLVAY